MKEKGDVNSGETAIRRLFPRLADVNVFQRLPICIIAPMNQLDVQIRHPVTERMQFSSPRMCLDICLSTIVIELCFAALIAATSTVLVKRRVSFKRRNSVWKIVGRNR